MNSSPVPPSRESSHGTALHCKPEKTPPRGGAGTGPGLAVFGGTFDPVHLGHLHLARAALAALPVERLLFIPGRITPFKRFRKTASAEDRLAMLRLAAAGEPRFEVSSVELDRPGVSYTVDTLETLRESFPESRIFLLLGLDSLLSFHGWRQVDRILELAEPVTFLRPGSTLPECLDGFARETSRRLLSATIDADCPDISSTRVRELLRSRAPEAAGFLPPGVHDYILEHRLYGE